MTWFALEINTVRPADAYESKRWGQKLDRVVLTTDDEQVRPWLVFRFVRQQVLTHALLALGRRVDRYWLVNREPIIVIQSQRQERHDVTVRVAEGVDRADLARRMAEAQLKSQRRRRRDQSHGG